MHLIVRCNPNSQRDRYGTVRDVKVSDACSLIRTMTRGRELLFATTRSEESGSEQGKDDSEKILQVKAPH